jgi:hypothetical protein
MWCREHYKPRRISLKAIEKIEAELGFTFPPYYREAMIYYGSSDVSIALLDAIVDGNLNLRDVSEIIRPSKIQSEMSGWQKAGMPQHLVPFARDCSGSLFCFSKNDKPEPGGDIPVHYFDHDFHEVDIEADSFEDWIKGFL